MNWRPDWYDDWGRDDWYGPLEGVTTEIPELLDPFQVGTIFPISAGFNRLAFVFLTKEYPTTNPDRSFGVVTWGNQTVEKLWEVTVQWPGTGPMTNYVGVLRESAIGQMTSDPITTELLTIEVIITGSYQRVNQDIIIPSQCQGFEEDIAGNSVTCSGPITALENQPALIFGVSSTSTNLLQSFPSGFNAFFTYSSGTMRHEILERPAGSETSLTPFLVWDATSQERTIFSPVLRGPETTAPLEEAIFDNPDSVELGAGWETVT